MMKLVIFIIVIVFKWTGKRNWSAKEKKNSINFRIRGETLLTSRSKSKHLLNTMEVISVRYFFFRLFSPLICSFFSQQDASNIVLSRIAYQFSSMLNSFTFNQITRPLASFFVRRFAFFFCSTQTNVSSHRFHVRFICDWKLA